MRLHRPPLDYGADLPVFDATVRRNQVAGLQYTHEEGEQITIHNAPRIDMVLPRSAVVMKPLSSVLFAAGIVSSRSEGHRMQVQNAVYIGAAPGPKGGMLPG